MIEYRHRSRNVSPTLVPNLRLLMSFLKRLTKSFCRDNSTLPILRIPSDFSFQSLILRIQVTCRYQGDKQVTTFICFEADNYRSFARIPIPFFALPEIIYNILLRRNFLNRDQGYKLPGRGVYDHSHSTTGSCSCYIHLLRDHNLPLIVG